MSRVLLTMTASFMGCARCRQRPDHLAILTDQWQPPRGWAGELSDHDTRALLIVSNNPGHPLQEGNEIGFWRDDLGILDQGRCGPTRPITEDDAGRVLSYCSRAYLAPGNSGDFTFHKKAVGYARAILWLLGLDHSAGGWLRHCWLTDAFKCSTRKENGPPITPEMYSMCREHLQREVSTLKPRAIVALGGRASLQASRLQTDAPVLRFRHPSNGCPQLHCRAHDGAFAGVVEKVASKDRGLATSHDFVAMRLALQQELFPRVRLLAR